MTKKQKIAFIVAALFLTAAALIVAVWDINSIQMSFGGLSGAGWSPSDWVHNRFPDRLIQPEWVNADSNGLQTWITAEICARLGVLFALWSAGIFGITRLVKRL